MYIDKKLGHQDDRDSDFVFWSANYLFIICAIFDVKSRAKESLNNEQETLF